MLCKTNYRAQIGVHMGTYESAFKVFTKEHTKYLPEYIQQIYRVNTGSIWVYLQDKYWYLKEYLQDNNWYLCEYLQDNYRVLNDLGTSRIITGTYVGTYMIHDFF